MAKKEPNQFQNCARVCECAYALQMYSTVKHTTRAVSKPNQTLLGVLWNGGRVSRMVMIADIIMREVVKTWIINAALDEVGSSRRSYKVRLSLENERDEGEISVYKDEEIPMTLKRVPQLLESNNIRICHRVWWKGLVVFKYATSPTVEM